MHTLLLVLKLCMDIRHLESVLHYKNKDRIYLESSRETSVYDIPGHTLVQYLLWFSFNVHDSCFIHIDIISHDDLRKSRLQKLPWLPCDRTEHIEKYSEHPLQDAECCRARKLTRRLGSSFLDNSPRSTLERLHVSTWRPLGPPRKIKRGILLDLIR
jgi:hypothetical protein